jgi:pseudouridylate synthase
MSKVLLCRFSRNRKFFTDIHIHKEVEEAIRTNKPVVALESTIISHGMPYPRNMEVALELERIIRDAGAVPATTAVLDGFCHVGLSKNQIEHLVFCNKNYHLCD